MRQIHDAGWSRIKAAPVFATAPTDTPQSFWTWVRKQDITLQRLAWFLLRMADAREAEDRLDGFQAVGSLFDPDRIWILDVKSRSLISDFVLNPSHFIA